MLSGRLSTRLSTRLLYRQSVARRQRRTLLSPAFALTDDWAGRHERMKQLGLGGDYEWIAAVQKKYVGGGTASAIDVDAAIVGADQLDQVDDVRDLVYKLRHTPLAADMFESTPYAIIRLFLKHNCTEQLLACFDDPINYGVFPNEHAACLLMDHFLRADNIQAAAKVASFLMLQEMFDCRLVVHLAALSCAKWAELPAAQQYLNKPAEAVAEETQHGEEDEFVFKVPYLKNIHFDGHFDLKDPAQLVGKSLVWFGRQLLPADLATSAQLLGWTVFGDVDRLHSFLKQNNAKCLRHAVTTAKSLVQSRIEPPAESGAPADATPPPSTPDAEPTPKDDRWQTCLTLLDKVATTTGEETLSSAILQRLNECRADEEEKLMKKQRQLFSTWNEDRKNHLIAQNMRLKHNLRLEEIAQERKQIADESDVMFFFENRTKWEKFGQEDDKIEEKVDVTKAEAKLTDQEYAKILFAGEAKSTKPTRTT
uniref:Mitochondrial 28S ribosomal protein S27 n=1 Tax=Plectus sambesii TaxID=2011161 RepID=A0A914V235_9BILA